MAAQGAPSTQIPDARSAAQTGCEAACSPRRRTHLSPAALRREAEDQARRAFLRTVSHELRTPLNAIIGFSEIIAGEMHGPIGEPRYREHAERVRDSGLQMLTLVNDILEIARLEADAAELTARSEPLADAFAQASASMAERAAEQDVAIACDVDPPELAALADARALAEVLRRLLENAIAFSPAGCVVRLRARPLGRSVRIEVEDGGPGVSPRDVHRLLRPFQQGERSAGGGARGAGLGLAVADLTAKAMGGHLRLNACSGHGLTAAVRLPAG